MIKFCPMCGTKVRPNDKLCTKCGLNFFAYQKKLERLASEVFDVDVSSTFDLKSYISSLNERYGYMSHIYFNVDNEKNQSKINSALNSYAQSAKNENVIFAFDDTFFGGAEDGFLVTDKSIYAHNMNQKAFSTSHVEVKEFSLKFIRFGSDKILINGEENFAIEVSGCDELQLKNLIRLLNEVHLNFTEATTPCVGAVSTPPQTSKYCRIDDYVCADAEAERLFQLGDGATTFEEKIKYFFQAAFKGHLKAQFALVVNIYCEPLVLEKDTQGNLANTTIEFLTQMSERGIVDAMAMFGHFYFEGKAVERDFDKAGEWYEKVVQSGYDDVDVFDIVKKRLALIKDYQKAQVRSKNAHEKALSKLDEIFEKSARRKVEEIAGKFSLRCIYFYTLDCDRKTADKINLAMSSYVKKLNNAEFPLIVFDSTTLGSADCGCLFTNLGIYIHNDNEDTAFISYKNLDKSTVTERGLFIMDIYIGEQKIETSICGYDRDERVIFTAILFFMKDTFGA